MESDVGAGVSIEVAAYANQLKDQGNEAFQQGDTENAIRYYTQAIDLNPDDHVFYSNRAAAYMKADSISKALRDAEKCVELAPSWPKGYNRLGVAQQGLRRFDAAMSTFQKGIEIDPSNQVLWSALRSCQEAHEADKKVRFAAAAIERDKEEARLREADKAKHLAKESLAKAKEEEDLVASFLAETQAQAEAKPGPDQEDDLLSSFLSEVAVPPASSSVSAPPSSSAAAAAVGEAGAGSVEEEEAAQRVMTDKYTNQDLGNGKAQHARLTAKNCEWKNLNPYYVLQLDTDATVEDIKNRYRKLSSKVHPDKNLDIDNARESFEYVKAAYQKLMDDDQRKMVIMNIDYVRSEVVKDRKRLLAKPGVGEALPSLEEHVDKEVMKHFADIEVNRRRSEKVQRSHNAREKMQETEEMEKMKKAHTFEKQWSDIDRREKRVGNWREFQDDPDAKKVKASSYKEEKKEESKFGKVKVEEWKRKWK